MELSLIREETEAQGYPLCPCDHKTKRGLGADCPALRLHCTTALPCDQSTATSMFWFLCFVLCCTIYFIFSYLYTRVQVHREARFPQSQSYRWISHPAWEKGSNSDPLEEQAIFTSACPPAPPASVGTYQTVIERLEASRKVFVSRGAKTVSPVFISS